MDSSQPKLSDYLYILMKSSSYELPEFLFTYAYILLGGAGVRVPWPLPLNLSLIFAYF